MRAVLREAVIVCATVMFLAGAVAAVVVPLSPPAWRRPPLVWGILIGAAALVIRVRRRRRLLR